MKQEFLDKMRSILLKEKQNLIREIIKENENAADLLKDLSPKDIADKAFDETDITFTSLLEEGQLKRIEAIETALTRISNGLYGKCTICEKKIMDERLEALPYALLCIECQRELERKNELKKLGARSKKFYHMGKQMK